jgi:acyl-CoA synthetase (AMP-forming)/AMP-acid ligase II
MRQFFWGLWLAIRGFAWYSMASRRTVVYFLERHARRWPARRFLSYGERRYSYGEANREANRHANAYRALGVRRGDVVAIAMENRPEFLWHVFGLHKIGAVASLINTNLTGDVFAHAVRICGAKRLVVGTELPEALLSARELLPELASATDLDRDPDHAGAPEVSGSAWQERLASASDAQPDPGERPALADLAAYIYTSGTTGLPKAALVKHHRMFRGGAVWAGAVLRFRSGDVLYNCLPLYHSNGFLIATCSVVMGGVGMALSRKFSRTRFWDEVRANDATAFIYIGELCRYLMNTAPDAREREHRIRVVTGNGLRPDIWEAFQRRFRIARVAELYGATEGNVITVNLGTTVGSVGRMLPGMVLVAWDEAREAPVRGPDGFLVKATAGQPGLLLGKIRARQEFDGYHDASATERKVFRDVFVRGDAYFDTGDLLRRDASGNLYFVDRIGDTFRWKGENVSTTEVQEQLSSWGPAAEVNVYGVQVPGAEGRAGMAALVLADGGAFDPVALATHVRERLPAYARPLFVRLRRALDTTGTFKLKKTDLQKEGFDPSATDDPVYFLHPERAEYVRVDADVHRRIHAGEFRL